MTFAAQGAGCQVGLEITAASYSLNWVAAGILAFGGVSALVLLLWPLFPSLLQLAPLAALLAFSSWFLVAARLRTSSPQDYLDDLARNLSLESDAG